MTLPFADTKAFSSIFLDYIQSDNINTSQKGIFLQKFYDKFPKIENFIAQIEEKKTFLPQQREILVKTLQKQYSKIYSENNPQKKVVLDNVNALLLPNTFTVTTGHQLTFLGSPAYFVYKILSTIRLANQLKTQYPAYNFVPVYWLASEDHDFEEVNHTYLFGKKYTWQTAQSGAVGDFEMRDLEQVFAEMPQNVPDFFTKIKNTYLNATNLSEAIRLLADEWFGEKGLVCIDAHNHDLKKLFLPVMESDILGQNVFPIVKKTTENLSQKYKTQINPREINFFYLGKNEKGNFRERIIKNTNVEGQEIFEVLNQNITFTKPQITAEMQEFPEHFSPNVVLRPLYQEMVLPNISYTGGPGELAYWFQLVDMFTYFKVPFPILMPRNFVTIFPKNTIQKLEKLQVLPKDLFLDEIDLKKTFLQNRPERLSDISSEKEQITKAFEKINQKTELLDKTLVAWAGAEQQKIWKIWENIEKRLEKTEELRSETDIKQLLAMREKIMPEGTLQERKESFLSFWLNNPNFLEEIYTQIDAFCMEMYVF